MFTSWQGPLALRLRPGQALGEASCQALMLLRLQQPQRGLIPIVYNPLCSGCTKRHDYGTWPQHEPQPCTQHAHAQAGGNQKDEWYTGQQQAPHGVSRPYMVL